MMNCRTKTVVFLAILFFVTSFINIEVLAQKIFEGYWEAETITKSTLPLQKSKEIEKEKGFYKNGKFKIINLTKNETTIIRFDEGIYLTINHKDKTYTETTFEQMQTEMKDAKNKMAEAMKNMDPQQLEMMKKMMGGKMGSMFGQNGMPAISFQHTGKKKTIKGYNCFQVIMKLGDRPIMDMWLTKKFNIGNDFLKIYQKMGLIKGEIPKNSKLNGFPIYTKMTLDTGYGKTQEDMTVSKIVQTKISNDEFAAPNNYRKIKSEREY